MGRLRKLRAATLTETVVAMVIIVSISAIAITSIVQALRTGVSVRRINAQSVTEKVLERTLRDNSFIDELFREDGFTVRKEVKKEETKDLYRVTVSVSDSNEHLVQIQNIFLSANMSK